MQGEALAWRKGTFDKESRLNYFAIEDKVIRYSDDPMDHINPPADCVLNMPPTRLDWLEARLPGGLPGVKHCGTASDDIVNKAQDQWAIREQARLKQKEEAQSQVQSGTAQPPAPGLSK